jgi:hypothetical protein
MRSPVGEVRIWVGSNLLVRRAWLPYIVFFLLHLLQKMAPGENGSYNVHTGMAGFGFAISVSEIDDLETVNAADGQITFGGASLVDVDRLNAKTVNATTVTADRATIKDVTATNVRATTMDSDDATFGSVITGTLFSTVSNLGLATMNTATMASATINTLNAALGTITDLTVGILRLTGVFRVNDLVVAGMADFNNVQVSGKAVMRDLHVTNSLNAANILKEVFKGRPNSDGEVVWNHAPLTPPVLHFASVVSGPGRSAVFVTLEYSEVDQATFQFWSSSFIGPEHLGGYIEAHFLALGS